jgi:hypothetical protein
VRLPESVETAPLSHRDSDVRTARSVRSGAIGLLALFYTLFLFRHASFAVGGSDSSGYANAARAMVAGRLVVPIETTRLLGLSDTDGDLFVPLGFVWLRDRGAMAPFYPPGFPLLMASASSFLGWESGPYVVSPVAALIALALFYLVARELGLSRSFALAGVALLAAAPPFVLVALQPLSDIVATACCLAAILAALASRRRESWAAVSGLAFGLAVLTRPASLLLMPALLVALWPGPRRLLYFLLGGVPAGAAQAAYNFAAFGSVFQTGYGVSLHWDALAGRYFLTRFRLYTLWLVQMMTPFPALGFLATLVDRLRPLRTRLLLAAWFGAFFLFFCFYAVGDSWPDTRFLLPGLPAMLLGFLLSLERLRDVILGTPRVARLAGAAVVLFLVMTVGAGASWIRNRNVLAIPAWDAWYPRSCRFAAARLPPRALVLSCWTSGALYYEGDLVPVRYDFLDPDRFRRTRRAAEARGFRWYALVMKGEIADAVKRVPGRWEFIGERGPASLWSLAREPEAGAASPDAVPLLSFERRRPPGGGR